MAIRKAIVDKFNKLEKTDPFHSTLFHFKQVCLCVPMTKREKEVAFFELIDPEDYLMDEEGYASNRKDREFREQYPSLASYNDEITWMLLNEL